MISIKIYVDTREPPEMIQALEEVALKKKLELELIRVTADSGDYIVSNRRAFERKTADDALSSFVGSEKLKILRQCKDLAEQYPQAILLCECELSDLFIRNIHPNAVWAMLREVIIKGCAIEFTGNIHGTATKIIENAVKEQAGKVVFFQPHAGKTKRTPVEEKEYILSAIPEIGGKYAHDLLVEFGSITAVVNAPEEKLIEVVGKSATKRMREVLR